MKERGERERKGGGGGGGGGGVEINKMVTNFEELGWRNCPNRNTTHAIRNERRRRKNNIWIRERGGGRRG